MVTLIKNIFLDIIILFRNFLHWNLSKLLIFVWSIILSFLSILPFILIVFIYWYFAWLDLGLLLTQVLSKELWSDLFINIFLYFITIIFFVTYFYQYVLLTKLNFKYSAWKKLDYFKNYYFNILKFKKYLVITFFNFLILLIPILFFILIIWIFIVFNWSISDTINILLESKNSFFTWFSLILFIISILGFIYLFYRVSFSYFIFIDDDKNKGKCLNYLKKSFEITKWFKTFFKFLLVVFVFLTIQFPSNFLLNVYEESAVNINNYIAYKSFSDKDKWLLMDSNSSYIQTLLLEYSKFSDDVLNNDIRKYDIYIILLNIFNFLFLYWITNMVFVSFYKRELIKDKL